MKQFMTLLPRDAKRILKIAAYIGDLAKQIEEAQLVMPKTTKRKSAKETK